MRGHGRMVGVRAYGRVSADGGSGLWNVECTDLALAQAAAEQIPQALGDVLLERPEAGRDFGNQLAVGVAEHDRVCTPGKGTMGLRSRAHQRA